MVTPSLKLSIKLTVVSIVSLLALLVTAALVLAQGEARVYPQAEVSGQTMTVEVMADNVTNMYGAEFRIRYDPAVVAVQDAQPDQAGIQIEPGSLLPADKGFVVANQVNEAEGTITYALTLLRPATPVNGSGPLARVVFNVLQETPSTINVEHAKLVAVDPAQPQNLPQTIPSRAESLAIGGSPQEQPLNEPTPAALAPNVTTTGAASSGFPWWIVAVAILVLGILVLGGFVVMGGLHKSQTLAPAAQRATARPAEPMPSRRPSAFNPRPSTDLFQEPPRSRR